MAADPGRALFYVMKPLPRDDAPRPGPDTAGHVSWHELYSSIGEKEAFAFYSGLFGWETMTEMPMGPMGTYRIFGDGETQWGGMMDKPEQVPASLWSFYVNVESVDAAAERVKAKGGQVIMGPMEVPGGSWVLQGIDPQGAVFALRSLER
jgi:predicted enzyme related to lactoylglutathione lyase